MRLNFVLLIKAYDKYDFKYWFEYHHHRFPNAKFVVIDNDSKIDIRMTVDPNLYTYIRICGFPNQRKLYSDIMNGVYGKLFETGDAVAFIDDDEFLYYRDKNDLGEYCTLEDLIEKGFKDYECLVIPHLNMSSKVFLQDRDTSASVPNVLTYRRNDAGATVKCIVMYDQGRHYEWRDPDSEDKVGHVPYIDGKRRSAVFTGWFDHRTGCPFCQTFDLENGCFAAIDFNSNVRLYHYHLRSYWDWQEKVNRGSCANIKPWYSANVEENYFWGGYDIEDNSMRDEFNRYVKIEPRSDGKLHDEWKAIEENDTTRQMDKWIESEDPPDHKIDYEDLRFQTNFQRKIQTGVRWIHENAPQINIEEPKNLADRINRYKLYDMNPKKVLWADKCAVYKELYDLGLANIRIPVMYEKYKPTDDDIREALAMCQKSDCILKCNNGSGYNVRFHAGEQINYDYLTKKIRTWLDINYAYIAGYEWQYEPIVPGIIVQPSLFPNEVKPTDYQFFCEHGKILAVELQRKSSKVIIEHLAFTDENGDPLNWCIGISPIQNGLNPTQKKIVSEMKPVVSRIANLFDFVRVDLFYVNGQIYFCEATFCPCSGVLDYWEAKNK